MEDQSSTVSSSPSFRCYSSVKLPHNSTKAGETTGMAPSDEVDEEEFEFTPATKSHDYFPSFPLFKADFPLDRSRNLDFRNDPDKSMALKELLVEEEWDLSSCSSSSEADELERAEPESYPPWKPNSLPSPMRCEKSKSTGSSGKRRRFRFRKFLQRSISDGHKYSLGSWDPSKKKEEKEKVDNANVTALATAKSKKKPQSAGVKGATTAHEEFYLRNRALKEEDRRRSYLPYRQDLFGFFTSVHGVAKKFPSL
ncbi:hypothetical protein K2173_020162 [Erythroxylum novogranatense]|uniref:Uncharacterized protein n=1 Tax=Erythroxylum novogranatense TaxID=1862640 RepID=A0AAV8UBK6_9ROSI|nr:hypothetical protein K2173_020162 [Erythroxylum novogranatense]